MAEKPATLNNLPPMPDHGIIDREKELEGVITALLDPDIPIVTLLGPAGTGKTALALAVAYHLREQGEFPGGIVWLNASAVQLVEDVWKTIRQALDLSSPQAAQRHLRGYPTLLILDGLDEAAQDMKMLTFLDHLPRASKALVTSRERIGLRGKELTLDMELRPETIKAIQAAAEAVTISSETIKAIQATAEAVTIPPETIKAIQAAAEAVTIPSETIKAIQAAAEAVIIPPETITAIQAMARAVTMLQRQITDSFGPVLQAWDQIGETSWQWVQRIASVLPDNRILSTVALHMAIQAEQEASYRDAIEAYRLALDFLQRIEQTDDNHRRYAEISHRLGVCLRLDGQWGQAVEQQEETFRQFKKLRDFHGQGRAYLEIARAYQAMNSYDLAVLYYNDAYRLFKRAGDVALAATVREEMGNLKYYLRILKPAMTDWEEAARLYEQAGRPGKVAIIRQNLAQVQSS